MRRKDKLVTDINLLHDVIRKAQVCRLGLVDGSRPYVIPLSFGFDGTCIYIHSACEGKKIEILQKNPRVCLEFEQQDVELIRGKTVCDYGVRYLTVICQGIADLVEEPEAKQHALTHIVQHYEPLWEPREFTKKELSSVLVFKITIEEITGKISAMRTSQ